MKKWHLGAMNDGLFIIDRAPSPSGTDVPPHNGSGPSLVLNVTELPQAKAQAIVDAHNAAAPAAVATATVDLATGLEAMRQACIRAALEELLVDATGSSDDEAYNRAIADAVAAIRVIDASQLATAVRPSIDGAQEHRHGSPGSGPSSARR